MKNPPDDKHLQIESILRGVCNLLPEDGFEGWEVVESTTRMLKTKIIRMQKNGQPTLAFEREGHPINVWLPKDSFDHGKIGLIAPIVRLDKTLTGSANPGYHSNIYSFFGKPKEIWFMQVTSIDELWSLIKAL